MSNFQLNGMSTGGQLYKLNTQGESLTAIRAKAQDDGLDQIYFEADGQSYVLEGDGLDLSGRSEEAGLARPRVSFNGQSLYPEQLLLDDEVNSAGDGLRALGSTTKSMAWGALGLSASLAVAGEAQMRGGITLAHQGLASLEGSLAGLGKNIGLMESHVALAASQYETAKQLAKLPSRFTGGKSINANWPTQLSQIGQVSKAADDIAMGQLKTAQGGHALYQQGTAKIAQGQNILRNSMKVAAVGVAVIGTVAAGGALYGALRGQNTEALAEHRGEAIPPTTD